MSAQSDVLEVTAQAGNVLVINAGSSSLKYQIVDPVTGDALVKGLAERVGDHGGTISHEYQGEKTTHDVDMLDHGVALEEMTKVMSETGLPIDEAGVVAVGHRVVHGGRNFSGPEIVTDYVLDEIKRLGTLAPLHNPAHALGIEAAQRIFPDLPQVVVFDTGFFSTLPPAAYTYAIDADLAREHAIRRYGFHGTSHEYVSARVTEFLERDPGELKQIICHLGNGASMSAIDGGVAVETSMGMTPLEGLVMGTRGGDMDPAVVLHLDRVAGLSVDELDTLLNKKSGILGMIGSGDFRDLMDRVDAGDETARLAFDVYVHRLVKYVGAYTAVLNGIDVITFTAGVGENSPAIRAALCQRLGWLGVELDDAANEKHDSQARVISAPGSRVTVCVVPTDEELAIARHTVATVAAH